MTTLVTDLNDRERRRLSAGFDQLSQWSAEIASALRSGDDMRALTSLVRITSGSSCVNELIEIMTQAVSADIPTRVPDKWGP